MDKLNGIVGGVISLFVLGGLIFGIVSPESVMHESIVATPWYLHALGGVSLCAALYVFYKLIRSEWEGIAYIIAIAVLLIFSLSAFMGFGIYTL